MTAFGIELYNVRKIVMLFFGAYVAATYDRDGTVRRVESDGYIL